MFNTFGNIFRLTSFGESHGSGIGGVIDGFPAGIKIDMEFIQSELDRRRPGQSNLTTPRKEGDKVEFLNAETSGIFITELKCGVVIAEGEEIGQIVEPMTGKILSRVVSPVEGYMFTIRAYPIVYEGSLMARVFKFHE